MEIIDRAIAIILGIVISLTVMQLLGMILNYYSNAKISRELERRFREHLQQIVHVIRQEQAGDWYYWYDNEDGSFIAQGRTWEEITAALRHRFPTHIFVLNQSQLIVGPEFEPVDLETGAVKLAQIQMQQLEQ